MKQLFRYNFLTNEEAMANPWKLIVLEDCLGMYDWSCLAKFFLNKAVSQNEWIISHFALHDLIDQVMRPALPGNILECIFCLK